MPRCLKLRKSILNKIGKRTKNYSWANRQLSYAYYLFMTSISMIYEKSEIKSKVKIKTWD